MLRWVKSAVFCVKLIYPILMDVMKPGETFGATLYHLFIYEDYHYGYPFYAAAGRLWTFPF